VTRGFRVEASNDRLLRLRSIAHAVQHHPSPTMTRDGSKRSENDQ